MEKDIIAIINVLVFFNKGSSVCKSNLINADLAEETVIKKINEFVQNQKL